MKQFLLVDDDAVMNLVHREMIQNFVPGCNVDVCDSSFGALRFLTQAAEQGVWPDIILLDINMPEMNGFELVERLHAFSQDLKASTRVLILSSSLHPQDQDRAQADALISSVLSKPLTREVVETLATQD